MILDHVSNAERYASLHPGFTPAAAYLRDTNLHTLSAGRHAIDGDRLFAMIVRGAGKGREGAPLETHRQYIDIQFTVKGAEVIGWRHAGSCRLGKGFDPAKDIEFYDDQPDLWVAVPPGTLAIFFPHDAHAPMAGDGDVVKAVIKVRSAW